MYVANNTDWNEGGYNNSQPCYVGEPFMPPVYGLEPTTRTTVCTTPTGANVTPWTP
ncbi:hypothetical protein ACFWOJ_23790 [Streptomyces sp. NPDC058439]|uniref:hypothetical protein n=1 Tax=Streptomyces sp. NPDC058439 TaxID=3346500 RepID=UPI003647E3EC